MVEKETQGIERILRASVVILCVAIVAVVALLAKSILLPTSEAPRTSIEKQLFDAQKAIEEDPKDLKAHLMLGITYSQMGKYKEAEQEYLNVIKNAKKKSSETTKAHYLLALNYESQGKITDAIETLEKVRQYEQSLFQLGRFYIIQKQYKKAIDALKEALNKNPAAADTLYYLGKAYEGLGKKKEAAKNYKLALKYSPDFAEAKKALGNLK